ncbi:MAG: pyridoxamine 5'-phosphate oxidase family protein [Dehalococcoidia bacterium]
MNDDELHLKKLLRELFRHQLFAAMATQQLTRPYNNLVAFATTDDLKNIIFATRRNTNKYSNLLNNNNVSMLIDNRTNRDSDFRNAVAVTAIGTAEEVKDHQIDQLRGLYLIKHHSLEKFVHSPDSALFKVRVKKYYVVRNFQEVMELKVEG